MIHFIFEGVPRSQFDYNCRVVHVSFEIGSFLALSTFGRQVNTSVGPFAEMCACIYMWADDPTERDLALSNNTQGKSTPAQMRVGVGLTRL
jgi:hypothetical protein